MSATGPRQPYIGGQAVIEGVMMRSPKSFVVAVRRHAGGIAVREQAWETLWPRLRFLRWPFFRGAVVLLESLHNGFVALKFSGEHGLPPEEGGAGPKGGLKAVLAFLLAQVAGLGVEEPPPPGPISPGSSPASAPEPAPKKGELGSNLMLTLATVLMVLFFIALPHGLTWLIGRVGGAPMDTTGFAFHLVDGALRVAILVGYIWAISKTKDAARLFEYHGAEHKAIWAYETFHPLTAASASTFSTRHPRCGTSFLFIVVGVAVLLHLVFLPLVPRLHANDLVNQILMVFIKVPMAFPIAGVAYELQRISAKDNCPAALRALTRPGIWLQSITTREPSTEQLEIAVLSLDRALAREEGQPKSSGVTFYESFSSAQVVPSGQKL